MTKIVDGSEPHTLGEVSRALLNRVVRSGRISDITATGSYDEVRWTRIGQVTHVELFPDYVDRLNMTRSASERMQQANRIIVTVKRLGRDFDDHVWFDRCVWEVAE